MARHDTDPAPEAAAKPTRSRLRTAGRLATVLLVLGVALAGYYLYWNAELRWRPKTIDKHTAEIAQILERSPWVSPGRNGQRLYMVSFRSCPDCIRFHDEQFPDLAKANVDTRVIMVARAPVNGVAKSTPVERATVAELAVNRSWPLMEAWYGVRPVDAWTGQGIAPADGDFARTAVVESGRRTVEQLRPLLKDNGVNFAYPLLVWWTPNGEMKACACESPKTYRFVRRDLGV